MKISFPCTCELNSSDAVVPNTFELSKGKYLVELWGASGGCNTYAGCGKGAYIWFVLYVTVSANYSIYVGGSSTWSNSSLVLGGCNGGGNSFKGSLTGGSALIGGGGGGSTSFGLSLLDADRIAVAGGGGGCGRVGNGGSAGGTVGYDGTADTSTWRGTGGNQTSGGIGGYYTSGSSIYRGSNGELKNGGAAMGISYNGGGGGGGYYGGGGSYESGGGGGSSYLRSDLYGKIFDGQTMFSSPNGTSEVGHYGDGYARITVMFNSCVNNIYDRSAWAQGFFIYLGLFES